jgi:hypothetical protein
MGSGRRGFCRQHTRTPACGPAHRTRGAGHLSPGQLRSLSAIKACRIVARRLFERHGVAAEIVDAADLSWNGRELRTDDLTIDMVCNRLVDFSLDETSHAALRAAYLRRAAWARTSQPGVIRSGLHARAPFNNFYNSPRSQPGARSAHWPRTKRARAACPATGRLLRPACTWPACCCGLDRSSGQAECSPGISNYGRLPRVAISPTWPLGGRFSPVVNALDFRSTEALLRLRRVRCAGSRVAAQSRPTASQSPHSGAPRERS